MYNKVLFLFTQDLRVSDNPALIQAAANARQLLCLFCVDPGWFEPGRYSTLPMGQHRWRFLCKALADLEQALASRNQQLLTLYESPRVAIKRLAGTHGIDAVYRTNLPGFYENRDWKYLQEKLPSVDFLETSGNTLFEMQDLPFGLEQLPETFSKFRKQVEDLPQRPPLWTPDIFPEPLSDIHYESDALPPCDTQTPNSFEGGAQPGLRQLDSYFSGNAPASYKKVRNALDGWDYSSKLSPWLASGCLSVHQVMARIKTYEQQVVANESTYWLYFELLWREYFQWYAQAYGRKLFAFKGIKNEKPLTTFYPGRFRQWCEGATPYPIVNACMKQLNTTGYMSNRGRQLVASCLVHEMGLDWRYGAAYFEQQLIDYDVASNWGNWQYLAGVGADPRGLRHFDLDA